MSPVHVPTAPAAPRSHSSLRDVPRGTTAGQLFRRKGVLMIEGEDGPRGLAGGGASSSSAGGSGAGAGWPGVRLVNVNNRLVPPETALEDGDLVILATHVISM